MEVEKERKSKEGAGTGESVTAEQSAQNTQTTRFMQEAEGRSAYYVVKHNVQVKEISICL